MDISSDTDAETEGRRQYARDVRMWGYGRNVVALSEAAAWACREVTVSERVRWRRAYRRGYRAAQAEAGEAVPA